ncbi:TniQ family protein [Falsigemmobacter intermedius]|uniref:TniQ family protein n=1 Tax=Falsigemmobacter intermedius TaxID=1553448 RepID=UPI0013E31BD7|nr:TniQ family protein [Falsigemmobacter intermedius]
MSPRLPLFEDETVRSWIERLTAFHGPASVDDLCRQLGINYEGLRFGERDDIFRLGDITGESPALIHRNLLSLTRTGGQRIGPHALTHILRPLDERHICLRCLRQDAKGGPPGFHLRERWEWRLTTSQHCSRHGCELTRIDVPGDDWREEIALNAVTRPKRQEGTRAEDLFHTWLCGEISTRSGRGWTAAMSLPAAVDAVGVIGATLGLGIRDRWQDLEFRDRQRALNAGYTLLCLDKAALRPALFAGFGKKIQTFGQARNHGNPMGALWSWMRNRQTLAPTDPLAAEIFATFEEVQALAGTVS